jgi:hypothetical protein
VYNYQGTLNANANLVATTLNATLNLANTGGVVPLPYGNGLAKANAIFLNGLIDYPGFYTSTAGFLSADQYLQDSNTYHNYSYKIVVEKGLNEYKKVLTNILHPAGMSMLGTYVVTGENPNRTLPNANLNIIPASSGSNVNANAFMSPAIIYGNNSFFVGNVAVGDMISYNFNDGTRPTFVKFVTAVNNANALTVESNSLFFFDTPVSVTNGSNVITSSNLAGNVGVSDIVLINANGNLLSSIVQITTANSLSVNTVFSANVSNTVMMVYPAINTASYQIIKAAS